MQKRSFTLVELMIVIAILAILSAIVIFALNPARLFDNFRDSRRVTDISSINKAIVFMESWNQSGITYGTSTNVYISLPDSSSTCSTYSLPTLPTGYNYYCSSPTTYKNTDGTGWIPINFTVVGSNRYLSSLPIDPVNNNSFFYTYYSGGSYELTAILSNPNKNSINDEGSLTSTFEIGSPNRTFNTPLQRDKNLIAFWKFDEASGSALDYSGNGLTGTVNGPERQTTIGTNKAMYYDASSSDYISTPSFAIADTGVLTTEAWTKSILNVSSPQGIISNNVFSGITGMLWIFRLHNSYTIIYRYANGTSVDGVYANDILTGLDNQWVHIVTVCNYTNKTLKVYRNGVQFSSTYALNGTPMFPSFGNVKYIGQLQLNQNVLTDGSLDEVRIYNRGLSAEEVAQHYTSTKGEFGL